MAIEFVTNFRGYDPHRRCISFWGHDGGVDIAFRLDQVILEPLLYGRDGPLDEVSALMAFDKNIRRIRAFARNLYANDRKNFFKIAKGHI